MPLKVVLHEAPGNKGVNKVTNIRIITRALVQNEQRLLSKKRAAINRHKSSKYHSINIDETIEATPHLQSQSRSKKKEISVKHCQQDISAFSDIGHSTKARDESLDSANFDMKQFESSDMAQPSFILSKKYSSLQRSDTIKLQP